MDDGCQMNNFNLVTLSRTKLLVVAGCHHAKLRALVMYNKRRRFAAFIYYKVVTLRMTVAGVADRKPKLANLVCRRSNPQSLVFIYELLLFDY